MTLGIATRRCLTLSRGVLLATLLTVAVVITLARLGLYLAPQFKDHIVAELSKALGAPLHIASIRGGMYRFTPYLEARGVTLFDPPSAQPSLQVSAVHITLDRRMLLRVRMKPATLHVRGAQLHLARNADGQWGLRGLRGDGPPPWWLLRDGHFVLRDSTVIVDIAPTPITIEHVTLQLRNQAGQHQFSAQLQHDDATLDLTGIWRGDPDAPEQWDGRVYVHAHRLDPQPWQNLLASAGVALTDGRVSFDLWGEIHGPRLAWAGGDVVVQRPVWQAVAGTIPSAPLFEECRGRLRWQPEQTGWRLDADPVRMRIGEHHWPSMRISFSALGPQPHRDGFRLTASYLRAGDLHQLLAALLPPTPGDGWRTARVEGELHDLTAAFIPASNGPAHWQVCTKLQGLGLTRPWQHLPALQHLDGTLCGNDQRGELALRAPPQQLDTGGWLRFPVSQLALSGRWRWHHSPQEWRLGSDELVVTTADLRSVSRIDLHFPKTPANSPWLDLQMAIDDLDLAQLHRYLPPRAMDPRLVSWIDAALKGGRGTAGKVLIRGPMAEFPFRQNQGTIRAELPFTGLQLRYNPAWPALREGDGLFQLHNTQLRTELRTGKIHDYTMRSLVGEITDVHHAPYIEIHGHGQGSWSQLFVALQDSPMRQRIDAFLRHAQLSGTTTLDLALKIPRTDRTLHHQLDWQVHTDGSQLSVPGLKFQLTRLRGVLQHHRDGIAARQIRADFLGRPLRLDILPSRQETTLSFTTRQTLHDFSHLFPSEFWRYIRGTSDFLAQLVVPHNTNAMRFALRSELRGAAIELPAPLGKSVDQARTLHIWVENDNQQPLPVHLEYGHDFRSVWRLDQHDDQRVIGGDIALGGGLPPHRDGAGVAVSGAVAELEVADWARLFRTGQTQESAAAIRSIALQISRLRLQGDDWGSARINFAANPEGLQLHVNGSRINGDLLWSRVARRIDCVLKLLRLPELRPEVLAAVRRVPQYHLATRDMPNLNIRIDKLFWRDVQLGTLETVLTRTASGMHIGPFRLAAPNHTVQLSGDWRDHNTPPQTQLRGEIKIANLGVSLSRFGIRDRIRNTPAHVAFALNWPGPPHQIVTQKLAGHLQLNFGEGQFLQVEPGVGRALGLLDPATLVRRLALDFRDLFGKGLAYDEMIGQVMLEDGVARTDDLRINGVTARIHVVGSANLATKRLDEIIYVAPRTSVALPIAGALAGGPAAGAALLVAEKLFGHELDRFTRSRYRVTGTWDQPEFSREYSNNPIGWVEQGIAELRAGISGAIESEYQSKPQEANP